MNTIAKTPSKAGANTATKPHRAMRRALAAGVLMLAVPLVMRPAAAAAAMLVQPAPDHELYIVDSPRQSHDAPPQRGPYGSVPGGLHHAHDLSVSPPVHHMKWVLLRRTAPNTAPGPCASLRRRQPHAIT